MIFSEHRIQYSVIEPEVCQFGPPFSSFSLVEKLFGGASSVHRAFSLARANGKCKSFVLERIGVTGLLAEDNRELAEMGYVGGEEIWRISFWQKEFLSADDIADAESDDLIGYFIAKCDKGKNVFCRWYVFESVFRKYDHPHNCVPRAAEYSIRIGTKIFNVPGVMYCQQNGLNKACAHVALRSLLSRMVPECDVSYSRLNEIARSVANPGDVYVPSDGLTAKHIKAILDEFNISYCDMDYVAAEAAGVMDIRKLHPYQNDLYAGVESGYGALLGFRLGDPRNPVSRHIIPFYGHTFNKDTWVTEAENFYFKIGTNAGYIQSSNWTSSFIGHDDNFGSNFCVPRLYINPELVDYVAALYPKDVRLTDSALASLALPILSELYPHIPSGNNWLTRFKSAFAGNVPQVVFRPICIAAEKYFDALQRNVDWEGKSESPQLIAAFRKMKFPQTLHVVEVSVPQLFAANERKIGDIVFDAGRTIPDRWNVIGDLPFVFARLPERYFILDGDSRFVTIPSSIVSHVSALTDY